jgi:hypothetical protein
MHIEAAFLQRERPGEESGGVQVFFTKGLWWELQL